MTTTSDTISVIKSRACERCDACGTERPTGSDAPCRCIAPRWRPFCTRCARAFEGEICPACLEVARVNGEKLRRAIDAAVGRPGRASGLEGQLAAHASLRERAARLLANFGIGAQLEPLPAWAEELADPHGELPPGVEHSRPKLQAVRELRLEEAGVRMALETLGYNGMPSEQKLGRLLRDGDRAAERLSAWDGLSAGADADAALRSDADLLVAVDGQAERLLETITHRDLSALLDAGNRRAQAVVACASALGIG